MDRHKPYKVYIPTSRLSDFVALLWYCDGTIPGLGRHERVLPHGCVEIIINLSNQLVSVHPDVEGAVPSISADLLISGPHTSSFIIGAGNQGASAGICLKPEGAYPLLGFPVDQLRNVHIDLSDIWPIDARDLRHRLLETNDVNQRFLLIEQFLLQHTSGHLELHPAVAFALRHLETHNSTMTINGLANETGISTRRFIDLFRTQVGLTPKQFHRVERFQNILYALHHNKHISWVDLALAYGYYDQSHFIRDFSALAGVTPTTYQATRPDSSGHLSR